MPMTPNEKNESRFARSSMAICKGVFCSSTCGCRGSAHGLRSQIQRATYILHHLKDDSKLGIFAGAHNDPAPVAYMHVSVQPTGQRYDRASVKWDVPFRTKVPMKAIQCLSPSAFPPPSPCVSSPSPRSHSSVFFLLGRVSPVSADSSISSATEVIRRISAGIRSPTEKVTRSPGSRALASGARDCPFLSRFSTGATV